MKKYLSILMVLCGLLMFGMQAHADSYTNSGTYIGTYSGNDNLAYIETILGMDLDYYSKVNVGDGGPLPYEGDFALTITSSDGYYSGTWATSPSSWVVSFYTVKAGRQFALYKVDPAAASGTWSTEDLLVGNGPNGGNQPVISHFGAVANNTAVPEPATLILLGLGLLGIAGIRKRK